MAPKLEIAPELVAAGKHAYEETNSPVREIAAMMGIAGETLRDRAREWGWQRWTRQRRALELLHAVRSTPPGADTAPSPSAAPPTPAPAAPLAPATPSPEPASPIAAAQREALALRIQQVVEREMSAVERLLAREGEAGATADNARALAGIARTLREVALLNKTDDAKPRHEADNDPIPRDIDEFRHELARRIRGFIADERARESEGSSEDTGSLG